MCAMIEKLRMCCMEVIGLGFRPIQNKRAPRSAPFGFLRRNSLNFSRFRTSARICATLGQKCRDHGGVDPVTTELAFPDQQDRNAFAPLLLERSVGVDVDLIDRPS